MLIRLLVAVLMLVGPLPFRVCTCAASAPAQTPTDIPSSVPAQVKKCRCVDCGPAVNTTTPRDAGPSKCEAAPPSPTHERDCPAVNPNPVVRDASVPTVPDVPTDDGLVWVTVPTEHLAIAGAPTCSKSERHHAPKLPLFITLLTLRN